VSLILSWVLFPLVLGAIGAGWGVLTERIAGARVNDALILPLGLAAALVVSGTLTAFAATAPASVTVVAVGAVVGLIVAWPGKRLSLWPLLAAVCVLLAYGAPVLLSGQDTFLGYIKLDDTATWFNIIDNVISHGRSVAGLPTSTYTSELIGRSTYPFGSFMLPGVARALTGIDIAWVFQPYLACCGAAVALCLYALMEPIVASARIRALLAFLAAQSALLYGYSLWGGVKELTAAFVLVLGAALAAAAAGQRPARGRELLPLAIAAGALIQTLGVGAAGWVAPALALVAVPWFIRARRERALAASAISLAWLAGLTAAFIVPVWRVLSGFLESDAGLFSKGQPYSEKLGNLIHPLSPFQLAGIWPVGDFRLTAPTLSSALLIAVVLLGAAAAVVLTARRRQFSITVYVAVALIGCGVLYVSGATPWVMGKALAISSPALLAAGLTGGTLLISRWERHRAGRAAGIIVVVALAGGVLWSNALAYHDATLAPRARLAELQHIGDLVAGKGPTFIDEYEKYAEKHFLRNGTPIQMDATGVVGELEVGELDSFPLSRLEPYRSIVIRRSPLESRPPSIYRLVWQGRYYQLWQRAAKPSRSVIEHVRLGEPVATPACRQIRSLAHRALGDHAQLIAYERPAPIVVPGDQTVWPNAWIHDDAEHTLAPTTPGQAVGHIAVAGVGQVYELWLDGSFDRGFEVSVDGRRVGSVKDQLSVLHEYVHIADVFLAAGVHTFVFTYPHADLAPGSGDQDPLPSHSGVAREGFTTLAAIALQPQSPAGKLIEVAPRSAAQLCGRPLEWIELVSRSG